MTEKAQSRRWHEATVDRSRDHFALRYGSADDSDWDAWPVVALVGPESGPGFPVQFLIDRTDDAQANVLGEAIADLDFYLGEKNERDPWAYLRYHCGTTANVYSSIHWSFNPGAGKAIEP